jgi:multidrug efflux system membrane fusion protein
MRTTPLLLPLALCACGVDQPTRQAAPPSHAEKVADESELLRLTLAPEAQKRLGLETSPVEGGSAQNTRHVSGEIVVPPATDGGVPLNSLSNLQQTGSQQAAADAETARALAQVRLARIALARAEALVEAEAGSIRARDEARAALAIAQAALGAAKRQRALLGPAIAALGTQRRLWVRATTFGGDVGGVLRGGSAIVRPLGAERPARPARPVKAPPSANAAAGTVDLYYLVDNDDQAFRIGQRVSVDLPLSGRSEGLSVPSSALVRDGHGGEWVYQRTAANTFVRQRVEVESEAGGRALLARGLSSGAEIVSVGAAELFGTEFGAAH